MAEAGVMVGYIRLLDVLSSQEYVFPSDDEAALPVNAMPSLPVGEIDVGGVVSIGLILLTRVVTPEILQHFPEVQASYFSVLSYALASSEHILPAPGKSGGSSKSSIEILRSFLGISDSDMLGLLSNILSLLLWGVTSSLSPSTARMALQGIQNCATTHITASKLSLIMKPTICLIVYVFVSWCMGKGVEGIWAQKLLYSPSFCSTVKITSSQCFWALRP